MHLIQQLRKKKRKKVQVVARRQKKGKRVPAPRKLMKAEALTGRLVLVRLCLGLRR